MALLSILSAMETALSCPITSSPSLSLANRIVPIRFWNSPPICCCQGLPPNIAVSVEIMICAVILSHTDFNSEYNRLCNYSIYFRSRIRQRNDGFVFDDIGGNKSRSIGKKKKLCIDFDCAILSEKDMKRHI